MFDGVHAHAQVQVHAHAHARTRNYLKLYLNPTMTDDARNLILEQLRAVNKLMKQKPDTTSQHHR